MEKKEFEEMVHKNMDICTKRLKTISSQIDDENLFEIKHKGNVKELALSDQRYKKLIEKAIFYLESLMGSKRVLGMDYSENKKVLDKFKLELQEIIETELINNN